MITEVFVHAREVQRVEIEAQQRRVGRRPFGQVVGDDRHQLLQRRDEVRAWVGVDAVGRRLLAIHLRVLDRLPAPVEPPQRGSQVGRRLGQHAAQIGMAQRRRVHLPSALDQVVRLVDQHADTPFVHQRQAVQQRGQVEPVVVVADHHIAPAHQFLRQVVRADLVRERDLAQRGLVEQRLRDRLGPRRCQPVVEAAGQRARVTVARLVRVLAGFLARHQLDHAQRQRRRVVADHLQRVECQRTPRRLRGQEEHLVDRLPRAGLQQREQRAHRLADAGRRLRDQAAAGGGGLVDGFGQRTLTGPEIGMWKAQRVQPCIARAAVRGFLRGPVAKAPAALLEKVLQRCGGVPLGQHRLVLRRHVEVHQRQLDLGQTALRAQQRAVDLHLRPVQCAAVGGHRVQIAAKGLDLLDAPALRVVAVGAAAHGQAVELAADADFGFVAVTPLSPPRGDDRVAGKALKRGGRRREAQVEIAGLGRELAQRADGH